MEPEPLCPDFGKNPHLLDSALGLEGALISLPRHRPHEGESGVCSSSCSKLAARLPPSPLLTQPPFPQPHTHSAHPLGLIFSNENMCEKCFVFIATLELFIVKLFQIQVKSTNIRLTIFK